jgi:hypothetical protein
MDLVNTNPVTNQTLQAQQDSKSQYRRSHVSIMMMYDCMNALIK